MIRTSFIVLTMIVIRSRHSLAQNRNKKQKTVFAAEMRAIRWIGQDDDK